MLPVVGNRCDSLAVSGSSRALQHTQRGPSVHTRVPACMSALDVPVQAAGLLAAVPLSSSSCTLRRAPMEAPPPLFYRQASQAISHQARCFYNIFTGVWGVVSCLPVPVVLYPPIGAAAYLRGSS